MVYDHLSSGTRSWASKIFESLVVGFLACFFISDLVPGRIYWSALPPACSDSWLSAFLLEGQITRLLKFDLGNLWDAGFFYPFQKWSVLYNEPTWGVSLLLVPFWLWLKNIFFIECIGGCFALAINWVAMYWFARLLGCRRIYSFFAAMTFCLSAIASILITGRYFFWPFFLIPVLGGLSILVTRTGKKRWAVLLGILWGYLGWCSAHLFVMGGSFLFLWIVWSIGRDAAFFKARKLFLVSILIALVIGSLLYVPMYAAQKKWGIVFVTHQQGVSGDNWQNLLYDPMPRKFKFFNRDSGIFNYLKTESKGEMPIGIPLVLLFCLILVIAKNLSHFFFSGSVRTAPPWYFILLYASPIALAWGSVHLFRKIMPHIEVDISSTVITYVALGGGLIFFRKLWNSILNPVAAFFLLFSIIALCFSFGPYHVQSDGRAVLHPGFIPMCFFPGISGIRAVARWGIMAVFALSLMTACEFGCGVKKQDLFQKGFMLLLFVAATAELFMGFNIFTQPLRRPFYQWQPEAKDVFLRQLPGKDAVLEVGPYPTDYVIAGRNLYASLYHRKQIVCGYASRCPPPMGQFLNCPRNGDFFSYESIEDLKKFGAKYWVFYVDKLKKNSSVVFSRELNGLRQIASLEKGRVLIYADPAPQIAKEFFPYTGEHL